jgi:hypothetical protein
LNQGRRGGKPAINRFSYGAASILNQSGIYETSVLPYIFQWIYQSTERTKIFLPSTGPQ